MVQVSQDIGAHISEGIGLLPVSSSGATLSGTGIDRMPAGGGGAESCVLVVMTGAAGAITSVDATLQESSDDGVGDAFANITGAAITQITTVNTLQSIAVNLEPVEQFVRAQLVIVGTSVLVTALLIFGGGKVVPIAIS